MQIKDVTHQMDGICPDDLDWQRSEDSDVRDTVHTFTQPCGCRVDVHDWGRRRHRSFGRRRSRFGKTRGRYSVIVEDCCFAPEDTDRLYLPTINWFWGSDYSNCNELHQAQELARLLLAVWKREMVEEYLADVETFKRDVSQLQNDYKLMMGEVTDKMIAGWTSKFSPVFAGRLANDVHLSINHHNPTTLDSEMSCELRERYEGKWSHKVRSQVLRLMDLEFDSREEQWRGE